MIARDSLPLSITEKEGFQEYCKIATPHFKLPSRRTITRMLDNKYEVIGNAFKKVLSSSAYITLTTDAWTDTMNSKSYLGVTVHFINDNEIMSGMLDVYPLPERHTAGYLAEMLMEVQNKWNITNSKVVCVVSDGAPNIVKAIQTTYGDQKHLHCFAHMVNLIPQKAISNVPTLVSLLTKIKQIVTFFKHSVVACDKLTSLQLQDGSDKESTLKLKQEVPTRWNSTFYMLERFKLLASKISMVLFEIPNAPLMVNVTELNDLNDILYLLKSLELVTKEISGQNYITTSKVIPLVHTIMYKVENLDAKSDVGKALRQELITQIKKRFEKIEHSHILAIATLLDPRFKKAHFKSPIANSNVIQYVNKELKKIIDSEKQTTQNLR